MRCNKCGAELKENVLFCEQCGEKVIESKVQAVTGDKICPQCGTANLPDAKYCKHDGYSFLDSQENTNGMALPEKQPLANVLDKPIVLEGAKKKSRAPLIIMIIVIILIIAGAGTYFYFPGLFGKDPMKVEIALNDALKAKGVNLTVEVGRDFTATIKGKARDDAEKSTAFEIIKQHKDIKGIVDVTETGRAGEDEIKEKINSVVDRMNKIKDGVSNYYSKKAQVAPAKGGPEIETIYSVPIKEDSALFSVSETGIVTATLKNVSIKLDGKTITATPDQQMRSWTWNADIDSQYVPATILMESQQPTQEATEPKKEEKQQDQAIDTETIRNDISNQFKNAGISGIVIDVKKDFTVVLKGSTNNVRKKQKAISITKGTKGVKAVKDMIFLIGI